MNNIQIGGIEHIKQIVKKIKEKNLPNLLINIKGYLLKKRWPWILQKELNELKTKKYEPGSTGVRGQMEELNEDEHLKEGDQHHFGLMSCPPAPIPQSLVGVKISEFRSVSHDNYKMHHFYRPEKQPVEGGDLK